MFFAPILALAAISTQDIQRELPVPREDRVIVADAIARFAKNIGANEEFISRNWIPIVANMPPKKCVVLQMRAAGLGASPVYCYDKDGALLEVFDNSHF